MNTFFRIDDRLIHGQIMTTWSKVTGAKKIIIIDDETAQDVFICGIMKKTIPKHIQLEILNTEKGIEYLKANDDACTIVLMKTPDVFLELLKHGISAKQLNVGGMGMKGGRKNVYKNIAVSSEELQTFKEISEEYGVDVEFKILPGDKGTSLKRII